MAATEFWKTRGHGIMDEDPNAKEIPAVELSTSPFPVYVLEQNAGDLVITPSMAIYQLMSSVCEWGFVTDGWVVIWGGGGN